MSVTIPPAVAAYERVLLPNIEEDRTEWLDDYRKVGGYDSAKRALTMAPDEIIGIV